ncbi:glycosyltransferase N-terminal domain-containing protein, partial [Bacteroidota bacterium]
MNSFWFLFYNYFIVPIVYPIFLLVAIFNPKVKKGVKDRRRLFEKLIIDLADVDRRKKMIWFHSASMGEFEQAKPIIEKLKLENDVNITVTFFSPSGYDNSRNYPHA